MMVQLVVTGLFGGEELAKPNKHGSRLYYPVVSFEIPEEPSERIKQLIREDKNGKPIILASFGTKDRAFAQALFGAMEQSGEALDFDVEAPKEGKKVGYLKGYPKPGDYGLDWPDDLPSFQVLRELADSSGEGEANTNQTSTSESAGESSGEPVDVSTPADSEAGKSHPGTPSPDSIAAEWEWEFARDQFATAIDAPVLKAVKALRLEQANSTPPLLANVTSAELDEVVERHLAKASN